MIVEDDADVLIEAYAFCERVRNRWFLVNSAPGDSLPTQPEPLLWLARSLDTSPSALREDYRRVTRRARKVVERRLLRAAPLIPCRRGHPVQSPTTPRT